MDNIPHDNYQSKYLDDEQPILIRVSVARALNSDRQAYFIQQVKYWMKINQKAGKNFKEGRYWTYNTLEEWGEQFPWLSVSTIQRIIRELKEKDILLTGNYNKKKYDKTVWYSINERKLDEIIDEQMSVWSKCPYGSGQNDHMDPVEMTAPIPEIIKENIKESGAPSKPSAPKDEKPKNGSDLGAAIGHYKDWFSLKTDRTPDVKEKDAAALKRVVSGYGLEDTKTMLNLYFEDKDPFYLENGFPLTTFAGQINKFVVKLNNKGFTDLADRKFSKVSDDLPTYEGVCSDCNTVIFKGKKHECYKPDQNTPGHDIRELTALVGRNI